MKIISRNSKQELLTPELQKNAKIVYKVESNCLQDNKQQMHVGNVNATVVVSNTTSIVPKIDTQIGQLYEIIFDARVMEKIMISNTLNLPNDIDEASLKIHTIQRMIADDVLSQMSVRDVSTPVLPDDRNVVVTSIAENILPVMNITDENVITDENRVDVLPEGNAIDETIINDFITLNELTNKYLNQTVTISYKQKRIGQLLHFDMQTNNQLQVEWTLTFVLQTI